MRQLGLHVAAPAASGGVGGGGTAAAASAAPQRIIDCHIHFYDPWRPGHTGLGSEPNTLHHRVCLTEQCLAVCPHEGVTGTVLVECSAELEDNQWLLDMSDTDPFIVGVCGHIESGPTFRAEVDRFAQHPRFCGIRSGSCSVHELRHLRDRGLQLDHIGGPNESVRALLAQLEQVPQLRVVINHMGQPGQTPFEPGPSPQPSADWVETMREAGLNPHVYMKVSAVFEAAPGAEPAPTTLEYYRPHLDVVSTRRAAAPAALCPL